MQTIRTLIALSPLDRVDTRVLLQYVLRVNHAWLIAHAEEEVSAQQKADFLALIARRVKGEPVAYLVGEREFYGLSLTVTPDVLIPRPDTELLVELALQSLPDGQAGRHVLDLGTGSGAIAIAIAKAQPHVAVYATDQSAAALAVARSNAARHQVVIHFSLGSWFAAVPHQCFDLIVSNPPYICDKDPHLVQGDLRFEPQAALTDKSIDGLHAIRHIISHAPSYLQPGGKLFIEHGYNQGPACRDLLRTHGFTQVQSAIDLAGIERVSTGLFVR